MRKVISLGMGIDPKRYRPVEQAAAPLCSVPKAVVVGTRFLADLLWCVLLNQRCGLQCQVCISVSSAAFPRVLTSPSPTRTALVTAHPCNYFLQIPVKHAGGLW